MVAQAAIGIRADHTLFLHALNEVAEQRLVEELGRVEPVEYRQALGHDRAEILQPSALRLCWPLPSSSEVAM